jgi:hypothetical protein
MKQKITRRDFLLVAGMASLAGASLWDNSSSQETQTTVLIEQDDVLTTFYRLQERMVYDPFRISDMNYEPDYAGYVVPIVRENLVEMLAVQPVLGSSNMHRDIIKLKNDGIIKYDRMIVDVRAVLKNRERFEFDSVDHDILLEDAIAEYNYQGRNVAYPVIPNVTGTGRHDYGAKVQGVVFYDPTGGKTRIQTPELELIKEIKK